MTVTTITPSTRSEQAFSRAFNLALQGNHRDSDAALETAHELRKLEQRLAEIAQYALPPLAFVLVKAAMTGFTDEVAPDEYIAANRESIQFYAANDTQLRKLIEVIHNPKPYQGTVLRLTESELEEARQEVARRCEVDPGRKCVTDPTITPAGVALQARGFKEFTNRGKCSILRECPDCRNKYSTKVYQGNRIYWHCPHCNTIKEA